MKPTLWDEIVEYEIKEVYVSATTGNPTSITIKSKEGVRGLTESRKGNWYWRGTRKGENHYAQGYIVRDPNLVNRALHEGRHTVVGADGWIEVED